MSTYKGKDDCTDTILDFIRGGVPEHKSGEAGGNYNAYFGHVKSSADFSVMTLDEVYAFQEDMLKTDPRSSAIGGYQFLRRTLQGLQKALSLPGSARFTPELQDRMAVELMIGRGYTAWWRGAMEDSEFAHNLAAEWASLPDPLNGGKSKYDGDGVNSTDTTLTAVYAMLRRAAGLKDSAGGEKLPPTELPTPSLPDPIAAILAAPRFKTGVQAFQTANNLTSDGVIGPSTLQKIGEQMPAAAPDEAVDMTLADIIADFEDSVKALKEYEALEGKTL